MNIPDKNRVNPKIHDVENNSNACPNGVKKRLSLPVIYQSQEAFTKVIHIKQDAFESI